MTIAEQHIFSPGCMVETTSSEELFCMTTNFSLPTSIMSGYLPVAVPDSDVSYSIFFSHLMLGIEELLKFVCAFLYIRSMQLIVAEYSPNDAL